MFYQNKGYTIEIGLPKSCGNGEYSVECTYLYDKDKEKYALTMWIKNNSVGDKYKIESQEIDTQYITSTKEEIKKNIVKIVEVMCSRNYFDYYIERYEYMSKCFELGNDIMEQKNMEGDV